jgi:uncharacterized OsmC-like protein
MGQYQTDISIRGEHHIRGDETPQYGGEDAGPMPTELFLAGIASCMCLAVAHVARKRQIPLDKLEVSAWGEKDMHAFRFNEIHMLVQANLEAVELKKLSDSAKGYCFVSNTIIHGCPIHVTTGQLEQQEKE